MFNSVSIAFTLLGVRDAGVQMTGRSYSLCRNSSVCANYGFKKPLFFILVISVKVGSLGERKEILNVIFNKLFLNMTHR